MSHESELKEQQELFYIESKADRLPLSTSVNSSLQADYGTFKDSLRAPIHRWFKYPAGYSYRLIEEKIKQYNLSDRDWILDPFVGSGTTSVEAKRQGVNSIGIEAHPFVYWVAQTKTTWDLNPDQLIEIYHEIIEKARKKQLHTEIDDLPELVQKCYSPPNLQVLTAIRNAIDKNPMDEVPKSFFKLALTDTLRNSSKAATGWPYIAPAKMHQKTTEKDAFKEFEQQVKRMIEDLKKIQQVKHFDVKCELIFGDAKENHSQIEPESIDLAITSPPYLNNYDYADRTRLETYFFGWYTNWSEITTFVRDRLMTSATTQIRRSEFEKNGILDKAIKETEPALYTELLQKIHLLSQKRKHKGGKKSYDFMVAGYFNDMFQIVSRVFGYLKPGTDFALVLGDSAPYGVYIPTHEYLAQMALGIGFSDWRIEELRKRGDKWKANPQRHKVSLNEVILTITK